LLLLGIVTGVLVIMIVSLSGLVHLVPSLATNAELIGLPAQLIIYLAVYLALWFIIQVKHHRPLWASLGMLRSRFPLWQAILGGVLLSFVVGLLGTALKIQQKQTPFDRFFQSPSWILIFGIFAVFLGPLFEELVFRGFIQPLLTRDLGNTAGILLTAFAFGLLHGPEYAGKWELQFVFLITVVGACLGVVRVVGRSLVPSVFMHAGFNAVFFIAAIAQTKTGK
jgi:uncharacterized protein